MLDIKYSYQDLSIVPSYRSEISSRKECNPFREDTNTLPIFTAPMDSIVNENNIDKWIDNGIIPIIPRNISYEKRLDYVYNGYWTAFSLKEFKKTFCNIDNCKLFSSKANITPDVKVVIDIANGHMQDIFDSCRIAKSMMDNYNLIIMAGNIANPETYELYCESGIDYVRCGIGGGSMCSTTTNTGIHYPMASLIKEVYDIKSQRKLAHKFSTKIIADGSIKGYADAIKALGLGADYVMIGGLFAKLLESAADIINVDEDEYNHYIVNNISDYEYGENRVSCYTCPGIVEDKLQWLFKKCKEDNIKLYKDSHGMSTQEAQRNINSSAPLKVSEGITIRQQITHTINEWTTEFIAALTSAMSYCNKKSLDDDYFGFIGHQMFIVNSIGMLRTVNQPR